MAMVKPDVEKSIYDLYYISFGWIIDWFSKDTSSNRSLSTKSTIEEQHSNVTKERNGEEEKERIDPETVEV
jgi:hypothetical protein